VTVETHSDAAIFDRIKDEWDGLLDDSRPEALYLSVAWQRIWWRCLGRGDLGVTTVRDDAGRLIGVAPWFLEDVAGTRTWRPIGCVDVGDYLDVVSAPGQVEAVLGALVDFLDSDEAPAWDAMDICSLQAGSPTLEHLPRLAQAKGWQAETRLQDVAPVIPLPGDGEFETYLEALDGKQRRELRRKLRRAEAWEGGVDWYAVGPEADSETLSEELDAFLELMAMSDPEKAAFLENPGNRGFFEELAPLAADLGWLRLEFLRVEGQRAAGLFCVVFGDRQMVYNSGFNYAAFGAVSPGWVLFGYSIADAIERGLSYYDFLRGGEDYKYRLGGQDTTVHDVVVKRGH
jgi:CelD/BcsL family acetyltransferase involved in cellulose biosynthesis